VLLLCWLWTLRLVGRLHKEQLAMAPAAGAATMSPSLSEPAPHRIRQRVIGITICVVGGVVASFGGMVTLGLLLAFMLGLVQPIHTVDVAIGGAVSGLAPLAVGIVVFKSGVKGMNRI